MQLTIFRVTVLAVYKGEVLPWRRKSFFQLSELILDFYFKIRLYIVGKSRLYYIMRMLWRFLIRLYLTIKKFFSVNMVIDKMIEILQ